MYAVVFLWIVTTLFLQGCSPTETIPEGAYSTGAETPGEGPGTPQIPPPPQPSIGGASLALSLVYAAYVSGSETNNLMTVGLNDSIQLKLIANDEKGAQLTSGGLSVSFSLAFPSTTIGGSQGSISQTTDNNDGTYTATFTATSTGTANALSASINGGALTSTPPRIRVISGPDDPSFSPNLLAWFTAQSIGGADASLVSNWPDSSTNGYHLTQVNSSYQPQVFHSLSPINFKSAVRFFRGGSGVSTCKHTHNKGTYLNADTLALLGIALNPEFTTFHVGKMNVPGDDDDSDNDGDNNDEKNFIFSFHSANRKAIFQNGFVGPSSATCTDPLKYRTTWWGGSTDSTSLFTSTFLQQWHVYSSQFTSRKVMTAWIDGGTPVLNGSGKNLSPALITQGFIGCRINGDNKRKAFLDGDIAELIFFKTALSDIDRQAIQDYLAAKYNLNTLH